jgi:adenylate kinase family enzyme
MRPGPWFIAGGPGSGKTTLARVLAARTGWPVLSSRDVVQVVDPGSIAGGTLGAREPVFRALRREIVRQSLRDRGFIVDGCPRTPDQLGLVNLSDDTLLYLWCRPAIALERLIRRGRPDDDPEIAGRRVTEQYGPDDGWVRDAAGWPRRLNTSHRSPDDVVRSVWSYLTCVTREVF